MKTLIFTNQKGGTGKTTSAVSVAAGLSRRGYKVLLVDTDPQGNATTAAGIVPDESENTTYEILKGTATASDAIKTTAGGYDIIPTDIRQSNANIELSMTKGRNHLIKEALKGIDNRYDFAIIDSPPNLGATTIAGLTAADGVIIALKADYLSLKGVAQLRDTIEIVKRKLNPQLEVVGVLLTFYDSRKNLDSEVAAKAAEGFPGKIFETKIAQAVALAEAPAKGEDIFTYQPNSKAAKQYEAVTDEILKRLKTKRK